MAEEKGKVAFTIGSVFASSDHFFAPGTYDLDKDLAEKLFNEGRGVYANSKEPAPSLNDGSPLRGGGAVTSDVSGAPAEGAPKSEPKKSGARGKLPEDFPKRAELEAGGIDTYAKLRNANQEDLLAIEGIGEASINHIHAALEEADKGE